MSEELAFLKSRFCCVFHKEQHSFWRLTGKGEGLESLGLWSGEEDIELFLPV